MAAQAIGAVMSGNGKPLPNMNGLLALRGETPDQKRSRELFIGNLPAPAPTEFQLKDFLSAAVQQAGMCTMPGTSLIQIRIQKNFAFAEFRSVEEANLAMNLNEIIYQNCPLSVGRPSRYTGPVGEQVSYGEYIAKHKPEVLNLPDAVGLPAGSAAALGEAESKILRELYVGNLPPQMTDTQLMMFLNQQMKLRQLSSTGIPGDAVTAARISNGLAFVEFRSVEETSLACTELNNLDCFGFKLKMGRPKKYEEVMQRQASGAAQRPGGRKQDPTCCLQLSNAVTEEELADASERTDIEDDIKMELTKFGEVKGFEMPTEGAGACKVYVRFSEVLQARVARAALQGRVFGQGSIDVWFFDEAKFVAGEWADMEEEVRAHRPLLALLVELSSPWPSLTRPAAEQWGPPVVLGSVPPPAAVLALTN